MGGCASSFNLAANDAHVPLVTFSQELSIVIPVKVLATLFL
jgi:hypothetical protein